MISETEQDCKLEIPVYRLLLNPIILDCQSNPIQIHHNYVIDNPNPITIQLFLEKDMGYKY